MNHTLAIVVNAVLSLLGLAFLIWLFYRALKRSEDPAKILFKELLTIALVGGEVLFVRKLTGTLQEGGLMGNFGQAFVISGSIAAVGIILSIIWTPQISAFLISPLTNLFDGGSEPPEPKPMYSAALAKRKFNKPLEAIVATREQLAKFPNDFEGVLLLANIQVEDLNDLAGAEMTLNHFCDSPNAPDRQVVAALTQLADWHLKKAADVDAARAALQKIAARFPDTQFSLQAEQRLAHLGETEKIILAQHDRQAMAVPEGVNNIGLLDSTEFLRPQEIEPGRQAAVYVKHLEQHPHDAEVRERLAAIYARDFKRLDLATLELEQLINEPRHKPKQVANWLNLLANFQIELGADVAAVRATLEKIVTRFPDLPVAEVAQRRLARINSEFKGKEKTPDVKLGVYEQNIGLKYGSPHKL
jgi:outer membrane protein assembly factor BamD (BamD/ComL family)